MVEMKGRVCSGGRRVKSHFKDRVLFVMVPSKGRVGSIPMCDGCVWCASLSLPFQTFDFIFRAVQ